MKIRIKDVKELWAQNFNSEYKRFQVYIHSPFCKSICKFCAYKGSLFNQKIYDKYYSEYLPSLITEFSDIIKSNTVSSFYFGGGTPSLMELKDMKNIFEMLPGFKEISNKYFEIHPAFFTEEKMQILSDYNFQTVIFGIQTFNSIQIKKQNRYEQDFDHVLKLVSKAKSLNLKTGIDLLLWEGNNNLYNDLIIANDLEFDVIFAAIDYNTNSPTIFKEFFTSINNFTIEKEYGHNKNLPMVDYVNFYKNIRLFRSGIDSFTVPGVFSYDSNFDEVIEDHTATLALGSFGNQMSPTTSNIGSKIVYHESNNNWVPSFNLIKKQEPFIYNLAP